MTDKPTASRQKVTVQEASTLVAPSQSRKLAALRDKARGITAPVATPPIKGPVDTALSPTCRTELHKARGLIDAHCAAIMGRYPPQKQNRLFALRFGPIESLRCLPISTIVKRLDMDTHTIDLRLLAKLNYHGQTTD